MIITKNNLHMNNNENFKNSLKIITWNVNGIRSRIFNNKICSELPKLQFYYPEEESSMANLIKETNPDIICIQETRCDEQNGKFAIIEDYNSYFNSSKLEKARGPNRYSGTAIYSKIEPNKILYNVPGYDDQEGRIIIAYYTDFIVINVYSPNSGTNYNNKILFQNALFNFVNNINEKIIYCGDFNIAIDTHFDQSTVSEMPGLYKHELDYYKKLIDNGFTDSKSDDDKIIYTWWDQRSRKVINAKINKQINLSRYENKGWRIDYIFTKNFANSNSKVLKHIGEEYCPHASDHAPVYAIINY